MSRSYSGGGYETSVEAANEHYWQENKHCCQNSEKKRVSSDGGEFEGWR